MIFAHIVAIFNKKGNFAAIKCDASVYGLVQYAYQLCTAFFCF